MMWILIEWLLVITLYYLSSNPKLNWVCVVVTELNPPRYGKLELNLAIKMLPCRVCFIEGFSLFPLYCALVFHWLELVWLLMIRLLLLQEWWEWFSSKDEGCWGGFGRKTEGMIKPVGGICCLQSCNTIFPVACPLHGWKE